MPMSGRPLPLKQTKPDGAGSTESARYATDGKRYVNADEILQFVRLSVIPIHTTVEVASVGWVIQGWSNLRPRYVWCIVGAAILSLTSNVLIVIYDSLAIQGTILTLYQLVT